MSRTLTPDRTRATIAVIALLATIVLVGSVGQITAIVIGAIAGLIFCRSAADGTSASTLRFPVTRTVGIISLVTFAVILIGAPIVAAITGMGGVRLFDAFYRAGSLVFGGGHVVLPLLQSGVVDPGWTSNAQFLAGYGVAQAVPGPLFTFSAYLGAIVDVGPGGVWGALIALVAIFLPGFLLLIGVLPFWNTFRRYTWAQAVMRGASAAVVGILASALYAPVFTTAITGPAPFALAAVCFVLLVAWKLPPWIVVIVGAAGGILITIL
jgi:chromate transporter